MTNKFNNELTISNLDKITNINIDELRKIQKYIVNALIRSKMLDKFKLNDNFQLIVDGIGFITFNYKHCDHCIVKNHFDGRESYEHSLLEAKLVFASFVLSIDP